MTPNKQSALDAGTSALAALLSRVVAASGADRELDELVAMRVAGLKPTITVGHEVLGNLRTVPQRSPRYTASLDAAVALAERVLPTIPRAEPYGPWEWRVHGPNRNDAGTCRAALMWPQTKAGAHVWMVGPAYGATPALALLAALLKALIADASERSEEQAGPRAESRDELAASPLPPEDVPQPAHVSRGH